MRKYFSISVLQEGMWCYALTDLSIRLVKVHDHVELIYRQEKGQESIKQEAYKHKSQLKTVKL